MSRYQEWAKRNWPSCQSVDDPDRFVEYSQADLDAYAERAFAAGSRSPCPHVMRWIDAQDERTASAKADQQASKRRARIYYWQALLGWAAFLALAAFGPFR